MSLTERTVITGVQCDKRGCSTVQTLRDPVPVFGQARRDFIDGLLHDGWAIRVSRGRRFYCPAHADLAGRCTSPVDERSCPVHGGGRVFTGAAS